MTSPKRSPIVDSSWVHDRLMELLPTDHGALAVVESYDPQVCDGPTSAHVAGVRAANGALRGVGSILPVSAVPHERPGWPPGYVGSISHSVGIAIAVAASAARIRAIGVDIEGGSIDGEWEALPIVLSATERRRPTPAVPRTLTAVLSAKEACFKALSMTGERFEPTRLSVTYRRWVPARCLAMGSVTHNRREQVGKLAQIVSQRLVVSAFWQPISTDRRRAGWVAMGDAPPREPTPYISTTRARRT